MLNSSCRVIRKPLPSRDKSLILRFYLACLFPHRRYTQRIMQRTRHDIKPPSLHRRTLVWLFSLLLVWLPYTEVLKAASSLPEPMPCHQQMASGHQHQGTDCLHDLGDTGCHCCQVQAPPGLGTTAIPLLTLHLRAAAVTAARAGSLPPPPRTPLFRPPIPLAS